MKTSIPDKSGRISQSAIARTLGVSQTLVSLVLAGKNEASPEMTERILKLAREKKYRPNELVRSLQTGRTNTVGVIVPADSFHSGIIHGIHDTLAAAGYVMILIWNNENIAAPDSRKELEYIHRLVDRRVDGVILRPTHDDASDMYFTEVSERGIPLVVVDRELASARCDFVGTDDRAGGAMAAKYLLGLGHRRLGQVAGPSSVKTAKDRRAGFENAVKEFGKGASCRTIEAPHFDNVEKEIRQLLESSPRPTAVFGANDNTASEIYKVAATLGIRIPGDLSVVGFADLAFASYMSPPLTTLRQNPYGIGEEAARMVLARCAGGKVLTAKQGKVRLKPELVVRASTASPA